MNRYRRVLLPIIIAIGALPQLQAVSEELLTIDSVAPKLSIEHWISEGKTTPVQEFESGKVYVVEFWATWCGPCIGSIPRIAELQRTYEKQGVRIIGVSDEPLDTVKKFLERKAPAGEDSPELATKTFGEITSAYSLATDPDGSTHRDYMEAAEQSGIPTAFIVGKTGKIEWIGSPFDMDEPLAKVVDDKWDRMAHAAEIRKTQERERKMREVLQSIETNEFAKAIELIDSLLTAEESVDLEILKLQIMFDKSSPSEANAYLQSLLEKYKSNDVAIDQVAWGVYSIAVQQQKDVSGAIKQSIEATQRVLATSSGNRKLSLLETLAHLQLANNDIDAAIATQTMAVDIAQGRTKQTLQNFLNELLQLKKEGPSK